MATRNRGEEILFNIQNTFSSLNNKLEKDVRDHLKAVYGTLCVGLIAAAVGAALHLFTDMLKANFLLSLAPIGLMIALCATPHTAENERKRFMYFVGFTGLSGLSTGPLIEHALYVEPSIIMTAFLATSLVFGCFTLAALHAPSTKFLHLGGILMSAMMFLLITVLFSRSAFIDRACLWIAFGINCALVLYDTQMICEKRRRGDTDYLWHTIDLFLDFINLFRYILAILKDKEMLSTLAALNDLRALVPATYLTLSWVPFASLSLGLNAVGWAISKKAFVALDNMIYSAYLRTCLFVFENISDVQLNFHGDYEAMIANQESAIILSNHQSDTDWAAILMLASRQKEGEHMLRVMVKDVIHYTPLFGWYIYQHGFIYVRRFKKFVLAPVRRQLNYLANLGEPFWLLIFPEGTRFSPKKRSLIESSQECCQRNGYPPFNCVLFPRPTGFAVSLNHLRSSLDAVYDITIAYGQSKEPSRLKYAPNMLEFACGRRPFRSIHFHIRRFAISEIPEDDEEIKKWLAERYYIKDQMLDDFYNGDDLPEPVVRNAQSIAFSLSLPATFFYAGSLVAAALLPLPRKIFIATVLSSPLLIIWMKVRGAL